jgi:hypothetical protein
VVGKNAFRTIRAPEMTRKVQGAGKLDRGREPMR